MPILKLTEKVEISEKKGLNVIANKSENALKAKWPYCWRANYDNWRINNRWSRLDYNR